jgi:hypothetical protein
MFQQVLTRRFVMFHCQAFLALLGVVLMGVGGCQASRDEQQALSSWCQQNRPRDLDCIRYESDDHAECVREFGREVGADEWGDCRNKLLAMHQITGVPPGPVQIINCKLGSSEVMMNAITCVQKGGTVVR